MSVGCKWLNHAKFLVRSLWHLKVRQVRACPDLQLIVFVARLIYMNFLQVLLRSFVAMLLNLCVALVVLILALGRVMRSGRVCFLSLLVSWILFVCVYSMYLVALSLFVHICWNVVHVTALGLVDHFVRTLFLHLSLSIPRFIFLVSALHGIDRASSFSRCWSFICRNNWIHRQLLRYWLPLLVLS